MTNGFSSFDRYYDAFYHNSARERWRLFLKGDLIEEGIPTAGSIVDYAEPKFSFHNGKRGYSVRFQDLLRAERLDFGSSLQSIQNQFKVLPLDKKRLIIQQLAEELACYEEIEKSRDS